MCLEGPGKVLGTGKTANIGDFRNRSIRISGQPMSRLFKARTFKIAVDCLSESLPKQTVEMKLGEMSYLGQSVQA